MSGVTRAHLSLCVRTRSAIARTGTHGRKVVFCLTGPYLTRRATDRATGELPLGRGRLVDPPYVPPPTRIMVASKPGSLLLVTGPYLYTHAPEGSTYLPKRWTCTTVQYSLQWCTLTRPPLVKTHTSNPAFPTGCGLGGFVFFASGGVGRRNGRRGHPFSGGWSHSPPVGKGGDVDDGVLCVGGGCGGGLALVQGF